MSNKWLQRLLAHNQCLEAGDDHPLETLKTTDTEVMKVSKVANLAPQPNFHLTGRVRGQASPLLAAYAEAKRQMEVEMPAGISTLHWDQALTDTDHFLAIWGAAAAHLRWPVADLFDPPNGWVGGLIWELQGGEVVALARYEATIERHGSWSCFCIAGRPPIPFARPSASPQIMRPSS